VGRPCWLRLCGVQTAGNRAETQPLPSSTYVYQFRRIYIQIYTYTRASPVQTGRAAAPSAYGLCRRRPLGPDPIYIYICIYIYIIVYICLLYIYIYVYHIVTYIHIYIHIYILHACSLGHEGHSFDGAGPGPPLLLLGATLRMRLQPTLAALHEVAACMYSIYIYIYIYIYNIYVYIYVYENNIYIYIQVAASDVFTTSSNT